VKKVTGVSGHVAAAPPPPTNTIYKWIDTQDGRATVRYSNHPPKGANAEPVGRR
jgi:hypothetical protein